MPTFDEIQRQFTAAIRDPARHQIDAIETRRLDVYRRLIFNNVMSFTQSAFPVTCTIMSDDWWRSAVREFLIQHRSQTPYFNEIATEFLAFLRESEAIKTDQPDFLLELMHYEWAELVLDNIRQDTLAERQQLSGDLMTHKPVLSSAAWLLTYEYPVHEISLTNQPSKQDKRDTCILVYRKLDLSMGFRLLNPVFAMLWQQLQQPNIRSGYEVVSQLAKQLNIAADETFIQHAQQALYELYQCGAVLGAHNVRT